ncbi:TonB-dependent receptor [Sphingobacterium haloxyli]|uniref:Prevent-host-death protein n=1 Tax=Sphingobacterium haloxyli TaxID=2100533 RepID=A0A2S9IWU7_9SPHI|nr:TonB-dependent receptor [Sphingobacterium haloxyli]PRD45001.1 prevent-host-death protein [Sphingobacterium haloxyli]
MKKPQQSKLYGVVLYLLFSLQLSAKHNPVQTIRGVVIDQASGIPLPAVSVVLSELPHKGTTTDVKGKFIIDNVPVGRHDLHTSFMGYETIITKEVLVSSAKEVYLEIALKEKLTSLEGIVVTPKINKAEPLNKMATLGAQMFSTEEAGRFAGGMDDPARLVSNLAGVTTPSVSNNGISIRGNAPSLLQWRLEDIEIPNPNHFADIDVLGGGFLSALSSNVLSNSDFFIGAFPAGYSNAVSGVFDMKLRNGNSRKYQHAFQLGILGIDFASEGPISKSNNSSYIINYRYSTTGLLEKMQCKKDIGGTLGYQDLNFKFNFPTQNAGTFSVWGVGLIDEAAPILDNITERKYLDEGILSSAQQKSGALGLSHKYFFGNRKTSLKTTVATTHLDNHISEEFYDLDEQKSPKTDLIANTTNIVFTSALNHKFNAKHSNESGLTLTNIRYGMNLDFTPFFGQPLANFAHSKESTNLISAYSTSQIHIDKEFTLTAGLNVQHLALNGNTSVEPRVGLKWQASSRNSFAVAYGLHSRMEKPDVYFVKDMHDDFPNKVLDFTKSHHWILAYDYRISEDMILKIEPYFQSLYDIPITESGAYSILNRNEFYMTEILVSKGKAQNYGVDVTFSKYFTKGMYYMLTASLFDSKYKAGNNIWYNTRYNRNFVVNGLAGKEWMLGRDMFGVNLKASVVGGQRYTPIDEAPTLTHPDKEVQYDESQMYSKQFSPMFIGDFSVSYKMNRTRVAHEFAVKSVNATRQREYVTHKYNIITGKIEPFYAANSLFNLSYRIDF